MRKKVNIYLSEEAISYHRRQAESPVIQVDEIDAPLSRCGIVEAEGLSLYVEFLVGAGDIEFFEV